MNTSFVAVRDTSTAVTSSQTGSFFFQPKLTVNTPGDAHEQEADRVADQVMRMEESDTPVVQRMSLTPVSGVQRKCAACEQEEQEQVQRKETAGSDSGGKSAPSIVSEVISSGGGQPMDGGTRQFMESRFGQDFGQVRIHTDSRAAESAAAIQARAYTSGRDLVFGRGEYQPGSDSGKRLLAHELVHVGQQKTGGDLIQLTPLNSPRFANNPQLQAAIDNVGLLRIGARGEGVTKVQHAFRDLGIPMPQSGVDGDFGTETENAVKVYQRRKRLSADGVIGPRTMAALDGDFPAFSGALPTGPWTPACLRQILCHWNGAMVTDLASGRVNIIVVDRIYWTDEKFDGTTWRPQIFEGGGGFDNLRTIRIKSGGCQNVALSLYHEYQHSITPRQFQRTWAANEGNAYSTEARWASGLGLHTRPGFVETDPTSGERSVNQTNVDTFVRNNYPGLSSASEEILSRSGNTVRVQRSDGSIISRPARVDDTVPGPQTVVNPIAISRAEWHCP